MQSSIKNIKDKSFKHKKLFFVLFALIVILFIFSIFVLNHKKFLIADVRVYGADILGDQNIKTEVASLISGKYFKLYSKKNILFYPKNDIVLKLKKDFPLISSVSIYPTDLNILQIDISLRKPHSLWCDGLPSPEFVSRCYFLDNDGFVFSKAPQFSGDAYFKYYGILPFGAPIGSYFLDSTQSFNDLNDFVLNVKKLNINPVFVLASSATAFEIGLSSGGKILFNTDSSFIDIFSRLETFLNSKDWISSGGLVSNIEYIDLRFGNKIFYKIKP
jgi:uncharacterized membrane protein